MISALTVVGTGELASLVADYAAGEGIEITRFAVHGTYRTMDEFRGIPVADIDDLPPGTELIVAVGYAERLRARERISRELLGVGHQLASFVSNESHVGPRTDIAGNAIVLPGAIIQPGSVLGEGAIIWPNAVVCHDSSLGSYCYVAPGATICGNVTLGDRVFVGAGSTIRDGVHVPDDCIVAAGAVVTRDAPARTILAGVPATYRPVPDDLKL